MKIACFKILKLDNAFYKKLNIFITAQLVYRLMYYYSVYVIIY